MTTPRHWVQVWCHCCGSLAAEFPGPVDPALVLHCLGCSLVRCPAKGASL